MAWVGRSSANGSDGQWWEIAGMRAEWHRLCAVCDGALWSPAAAMETGRTVNVLVSVVIDSTIAGRRSAGNVGLRAPLKRACTMTCMAAGGPDV